MSAAPPPAEAPTVPRRVALIHDYLNQYGGAERVLEALHAIFPGAPVFTSIYDAEAMPQRMREWDIRTTWMQRLPGWRRHFRAYFALYPLAFEQIDLSGYDLILSSSSAYAKGVRPAAGARHICYCHTPMRFAWRTASYIAREDLGVMRLPLELPMSLLRRWDIASAPRVTQFLANSREVAGRIRACYGREALVVPPPVTLPPFTPSGTDGDYYLAGGRLIPYKRVDLAIEACNALGLPLVVFGNGRDRAALEAIAGPTISFTGWVSEQERRDLFAGCRAHLFPGEEDFGITPLEAMAAGRPVVAYAAGGALDTVVDGVSGRFFAQQTAASLASAITALAADEYDALTIRRHAEGFGPEIFAARIAAIVTGSVAPARA